jgi:subtilisin-like proprotein convertase family protein
MTAVNLAHGGPAAPANLSAGGAASSPIVVRAADTPQPVDFLDVFTTSFVDVPQNVTIGNLKVQLDITYPLDNDLTIDLIAPNGTDVPLSSFEGAGANFQNTTFDDGAATPIWAGNSPFAGSYQPESPLSALAGTNAQGTWELQIIDWGGSFGTLNSWSLIIQPTASPTTLLAAAAPSVTAGTSLHAAAPSSPQSLAPIDAPALLGLAADGLKASPLPSTLPAAGNTVIAGQGDALAAISAVPRQAASDHVPAGRERTSLAEATSAADAAEPADAGNALPLLHPPGHGRLANG